MDSGHRRVPDPPAIITVIIELLYHILTGELPLVVVLNPYDVVFVAQVFWVDVLPDFCN